MMHSVLSRRAAELQDMMAGMNEFGLIDFLKLNKDVVLPVLFPRVEESIIDCEKVKGLIQLEEEELEEVESTVTHIADFLKQYIDGLESQTEGMIYKLVLICTRAQRIERI